MIKHRPLQTSGTAPSWRARAMIALVGIISVGAFGWTATGAVKNASGKVLSGVAVSIQDSAAKFSTTTDAAGAFMVGSPVGVSGSAARAGFEVRQVGSDLVISREGNGLLEISLLDLSGAIQLQRNVALVAGRAQVAIPTSLRATASILRIRDGEEVVSQMTILQGAHGWRTAPSVLSRAAAVFPTLLFKKAGYKDASFPMTSETMTGIAVAMDTAGSFPDLVEDHRSECVIPAMPAVSALVANPALPNPFKMMDGTAVTTLAQWKCRREEIAALLEKYVHGEKPRKPEKVSGVLSGNTFTVSVTDKGKTVSFTVSITKPTSGTAPYPAIIGWSGGNIGGYSSLPVAKINFDPSKLASEGSGRGKGVFYDLYGSNAAASELMAHAWGISRLIDALAATPAAGINPRRLAVTGCSRWGKSASVAGSFDQRIRLVIPQESGSGGVASWRIIPSFPDAQPIASTANEAYWTRADFLSNFGSSITKLPSDHHEMIGMIAPNALLVLDNTIGWLGPQVGWASTNAAKEIFTAVGAPDAITYSSVGGHTHCAQPASQDHWVKSYVQKYLLDGTGEAGKMEAPADYKFDRAKWINWTTPTLK